MSEYKRLTEKSPQLKVPYPAKENSLQDCITRLAELEDEIENGTSVRLPCIRETLSNGAKWELVYLNKYSQIITETFDIDELDEAEAKLRELKGGN